MQKQQQVEKPGYHTSIPKKYFAKSQSDLWEVFPFDWKRDWDSRSVHLYKYLLTLLIVVRGVDSGESVWRGITI